MKVLLFDLDGTLLRSDKSISDRTYHAVMDARKRGYYIGISTSRSENNSLNFIDRISPEIIISSAGAMVSLKGETIVLEEFSAEETGAVIAKGREICGDLNISVDTAGEKAEYYCNFDIPEIELAKDGDWYKITRAGITKETAIAKLCNYLGIGTDDITAFGDDLADIGMLKMCGTGVAMGNALPEVKEAADIIIGTNDEDGIADYLRYLMKDHMDEQWYQYLYYTENDAVNIERVDTVEGITGHETLDYVLRTLDILEENENTGYGDLSGKEFDIIRTVLSWSEVAKGGSVKDRDRWRKKGYPLDIHNIASAEIYFEEASGDDPDREIIRTLIRTHGMIGQCLRGEVPVSQNAPLKELPIEKDRLLSMLSLLNECIIRGVSDALWERVGNPALSMIKSILEGSAVEFSARERIQRLLPGLDAIPERLVSLFEYKLFPHYELWYFEAALSDFDADQIFTILSDIPDTSEYEDVCYISFKPLSDSLYYDYEGKKHINIYKKRIIEKHLRDSSTENVSFSMKREGNALLVNYEFSKVCEKLIDFCVEAERSGLLSFEKSITVLYDMFGFRRDEFDRLNNEDKYLATMNNSEESTKNSIIDYVTGQKVVDVGSGGGVLLDLLEERYPDKLITGTDISENVIDILNRKKRSEGHRWSVVRHNFADGPFMAEGKTETVDTVIFSSIIHEIFSYTETAEGRFNIDVVKQALKNAYDSLGSGGRIIIRDGIRVPEEKAGEMIKVRFKESSGLEFFKNFVQDFEGLKDVEDKHICVDEENMTVSACADYIREFLYTYTWGQESYSHEVNEQFGYFTIKAYREFLESLGAKLIRADAFLEPGYPEHLRPLVDLDPDVYPDSNCILVAEKC